MARNYLKNTSLPLQGGGEEGDGVAACIEAKRANPIPAPDPPLEGEGFEAGFRDMAQRSRTWGNARVVRQDMVLHAKRSAAFRSRANG